MDQGTIDVDATTDDQDTQRQAKEFSDASDKKVGSWIEKQRQNEVVMQAKARKSVVQRLAK